MGLQAIFFLASFGRPKAVLAPMRRAGYARIMRFALLTLALLCPLAPSGCGPMSAPDEASLPIEKGSGWELERDFQQIVALAQSKDSQAVTEAMGAFLLTREEIFKIFGPEDGPRVWKGYSETIAPELRKQVAGLLIKRVGEGYTEAFAKSIGPAYPQFTTAGDKVLLNHMRTRYRIYTVWIRPPGAALGVRLNGFIYMNGRWKSMFKSYDYLGPLEPDAAPPTPSPVDGGL